VKPDGSTDGTTYGKLYNSYAVMGITVAEDFRPTAAQIAARKQLAPIGWHVPTDNEWSTLETFLGRQLAGGSMKETGTTHWVSPNTDPTNSSGFTGLPGGYRYSGGIFNNVSFNVYWWSSSEFYTADAWFRHLYCFNGDVDSYYGNKTNGFSVRCLRD
jgi:uncharacterized protein (TIGR02145 family)